MTTFLTLKNDTIAYLARTDSDFASRLNTFARNMEARIRRDLRVESQLTSTTITPTSDTHALPTGFLEARSITFLGSNEIRVLDRHPPEILREIMPQSGDVQAFAIEGTNIKFAPAFTSANTTLQIEILYYGAFTALSSDSDTNWLLTNAYDLCLALMCYEGAKYCQDLALANAFMQEYQQIRAELQTQQTNHSHYGSVSVSAGSNYAV